LPASQQGEARESEKRANQGKEKAHPVPVKASASLRNDLPARAL
jgi:hypothetical protein